MKILLQTILWFFMTVGTLAGAACMVNRRSEEGKTYYSLGGKQLLLYLACLAGTLYAGYMAALKSQSPEGWTVMAFCCAGLLAAAVFDYKLYIIPNAVPCFLIITKLLVLAWMAVSGGDAGAEAIGSAVGCILCFVILTAAGRLSKGGVGKGDVKLLSSLGFACGIYPAMITMTLALVLCAGFALVLVGLKKASWKEHIPFGPFIYLGYLIMVCYI